MIDAAGAGPLPVEDARWVKIRRMECELDDLLMVFSEKYQLTTAESVYLLSNALAQIGRWAVNKERSLAAQTKGASDGPPPDAPP